jgi:hypothetical protein
MINTSSSVRKSQQDPPNRRESKELRKQEDRAHKLAGTGIYRFLHIQEFMTPTQDLTKMNSHPENKGKWIPTVQNKGHLVIQCIGDSYQIKCDLVKHKQQWHEAAREIIMKRWKKEKFRAIVIDPPYQKTGCNFPYHTLPFEQIFNCMDFNWLTDDALIFIWVTNHFGTKVSIKMAELGWEEKEVLTWCKYDKDKLPLFRGGHDMRHINEKCYVFKRANPINKLEKWYHQ